MGLGWRLRKTKVAVWVSGAVSGPPCSWPWDEEEEEEEEGREVRVACVPAGRTLGFGRRLEGGMVIVREEDKTAVAKRRREGNRDGIERCIL